MPTSIVTTGWPKINAQCGEMGIAFDGWQDGAGKIAFGKRADGKYAATVGGIVLSIPRQVGKTFFVGAIIFAFCILFPGSTVLWTAHRTRTSTRTFQSLQRFAKRSKIAPHIKSIRSANGEQEIRFHNDSVILFGAREQGFGRGFEEVDIEVFDEAQILTDKALEDMIAATNQARHVHGALLFFIGTPPRPSDPGEAFSFKRTKALKAAAAGGQCDIFYVELSADRDAKLDDRKQWAKANPSYPHRTPEESMLRLRENLPSEDAWKREALGIWDEIGIGQRPFAPGTWAKLKSKRKRAPKPNAIGISADKDQAWLNLGAATNTKIPYLGSVLRSRADTERASFVARVAQIQEKRDCLVAIDPKGPAGFLVEDLEEAGVTLTKIKQDDFVAACAGIRSSVATAAVEHGDFTDLNAAVDAAGWRNIGARKVFDRSEDIAMLEAVAIALWAATVADYDVLDTIY